MCLSFIIWECAAHDNNFTISVSFLLLWLHPLKHIIKRQFNSRLLCEVLSNFQKHIRCSVRYRVRLLRFYVFWHEKMITEWKKNEKKIMRSKEKFMITIACSSVAFLFVFINKLNSRKEHHEKLFSNKHFYAYFSKSRVNIFLWSGVRWKIIAKFFGWWCIFKMMIFKSHADIAWSLRQFLKWQNHMRFEKEHKKSDQVASEWMKMSNASKKNLLFILFILQCARHTSSFVSLTLSLSFSPPESIWIITKSMWMNKWISTLCSVVCNAVAICRRGNVIKTDGLPCEKWF